MIKIKGAAKPKCSITTKILKTKNKLSQSVQDWLFYICLQFCSYNIMGEIRGKS